jgi:hypothetical protein
VTQDLLNIPATAAAAVTISLLSEIKSMIYDFATLAAPAAAPTQLYDSSAVMMTLHSETQSMIYRMQSSSSCRICSQQSCYEPPIVMSPLSCSSCSYTAVIPHLLWWCPCCLATAAPIQLPGLTCCDDVPDVWEVEKDLYDPLLWQLLLLIQLPSLTCCDDVPAVWEAEKDLSDTLLWQLLLLTQLSRLTCCDDVPAVGEAEKDLSDTLLWQLLQAATVISGRYSAFFSVLLVLQRCQAGDTPPINNEMSSPKRSTANSIRTVLKAKKCY